MIINKKGDWKIKRIKKLFCVLICFSLLFGSNVINVQATEKMQQNSSDSTYWEMIYYEDEMNERSTTGKSVVVNFNYIVENTKCFTLTQNVTFTYGNEDGNARIISYESEITYLNSSTGYSVGNILTDTINKTGNPAEYCSYVPVYYNGNFVRNFYCASYYYNNGNWG